MATVKLIRTSAWGDKFRSYKIRLDDADVGTIKQGDTWTHQCSTGQHSIQLKIDWCSSPKVNFEVTSVSETITFECRNNVNPLLALLYIFMPSKWIALNRKP